MTQDITINTVAQKHKKGFTLTEIAIVLGIIGLILGAVWSAATSVYSSQSASAFSQTMALYIAAVRSACNGQCTSTVPIVTVSVPNITNSGVTATAGIVSGNINLAYTMPAATAVTKQTSQIYQGLQAAGNITGGSFGPTIPTVTPTCVGSGGAAAAAKPALCTPSSVTGFTISGPTGSSTCTANTGTPATLGTCSATYTGAFLPATTYNFQFSQSF